MVYTVFILTYTNNYALNLKLSGITLVKEHLNPRIRLTCIIRPAYTSVVIVQSAEKNTHFHCLILSTLVTLKIT